MSTGDWTAVRLLSDFRDDALKQPVIVLFIGIKLERDQYFSVHFTETIVQLVFHVQRVKVHLERTAVIENPLT